MILKYHLGIDVGSTTTKAILLNNKSAVNSNTVFSDYQRHHADILGSISLLIGRLLSQVGDITFSLTMTGSAGMGLSENLRIPFVQEVICASGVTKKMFPDVRTLIDIGGEDSKLLLYNSNGKIDIRMNGNCAGGTGAFIDQMAALLGIPIEKLNKFAQKSSRVYSIASRCGVFAKTDIQNLLSLGVSRTDIAGSIFNAIALQAINTLLRGFAVREKVIFSGGAFAFFPELRKAFIKHLKIEEKQIVYPESALLLSATGAAVHKNKSEYLISARDLLNITRENNYTKIDSDRKPPLFKNTIEYVNWQKKRYTRVNRSQMSKLNGKNCFLGIDSGSTTTKMVLIDSNYNVVDTFYAFNDGDFLGAVKKGLTYLKNSIREDESGIKVGYSAVTGYGEDLIKTIYKVNAGVVETIAHFRAAKIFNPKASFILDLGGQDMKAIFVVNNEIQSIEINEACSSGCGSFIHTFANSLGIEIEEFSEIACTAPSPCRLGSRCTVFMNSRVKQFLKEGANIEDISAGLSYSVIENAIQKVLKIKDMGSLGNEIVVQGGTFTNPSIQRAFEIITGNKVTCPDISGYMGAYGAAIIAKDEFSKKSPGKTESIFDSLCAAENMNQKTIVCMGCMNNCIITRLRCVSHEKHDRVYYTGNKCESVYSNRGETTGQGINQVAKRNSLLFNIPPKRSDSTRGRIGIPRALNIYECFPFFSTLLTECGFEVVLSSPSFSKLYNDGSGSIMSDNICFPAKLVHGHIVNLINQDVDRIFYPMVVYEPIINNAKNSYNCPIVTGYPDVIDSSVNPHKHFGIYLDKPPITMKSRKLLRKNCQTYLKQFGIKNSVINRALTKALSTQAEIASLIRKSAVAIIEKNEAAKSKMILLAGRPYHYDPLINHKLPEIISGYGMDVVSIDAVGQKMNLNGDHKIHAFSQWAYTNRLYSAAFLATRYACLEVVCINSFGCGPDAVAIDETSEILKAYGKKLTVIRVDEMAGSNSMRLRIRTLIEMLKWNQQNPKGTYKERKKTKPYTDNDKKKQLIIPAISTFHSSFIKDILDGFGYDVSILPDTDSQSRDIGLKYTNNEMCYPAMLIIGDIIKALTSGACDPSNTVVGFFQTGGQCRLSSYNALVQKALVAAGFGNVPVIPIVLSVNGLHHKLLRHPSFKLNIMKVLKAAFNYVLFSDALSRMYYSTVSREICKGQSLKLLNKFISLGINGKVKNKESRIFEILQKAIIEFNKIEIHENRRCPKIGIVGEIYVKYNSFSNLNIVEWLIENGVEVEIPPLMNSVTQMLLNKKFNRDFNLIENDSFWILSPFFLRKAKKAVAGVNKIFRQFRFHKPLEPVGNLKDMAADILSLSNQFGEGWLIAAEIMLYAKEGINNILCLQPFGCIANQVIAKGVEKKIKDLNPDINILFIDLDFDTSEVNIHNRLHFLIQNAADECA